MSKKRKKDYVKSFKELYSRDPSEEELKAFIECMQAKKKNGNKPKEKRRK